MARSPLTETIKRVEGMVAYVRENLNPGEYDLFLDMVDPQPDPAPAKKSRKKRTTKSAKAQSLSSAIAKAPKVEGDSGAWCTAKVPGLDVVCGDPEDNLIHDPKAGYTAYHPFVPPAQPAEKRSRRKGAGANTTANTEIETGAAMGARS